MINAPVDAGPDGYGHGSAGPFGGDWPLPGDQAARASDVLVIDAPPSMAGTSSPTPAGSVTFAAGTTSDVTMSEIDQELGSCTVAGARAGVTVTFAPGQTCGRNAVTGTLASGTATLANAAPGSLGHATGILHVELHWTIGGQAGDAGAISGHLDQTFDARRDP